MSNDTKDTIIWSYEGTCGPAYWGKLAAEFHACDDGQMQSPIDLTKTTLAESGSLHLTYHPTPVNIINTGRSVQLDVAPGNTITLNGATAQLEQLHFHMPAEHTMNGQRLAMEMHLVHVDSSGNMTALAVLIEEQAEARCAIPPPEYAKLWAYLPRHAGQRTRIHSRHIDLNALLPDDVGRYVTYTGSLTTPPCTEGVQWVIFVEPVMLPAAQIAVFRKLYNRTARPLQPRNDRLVQRHKA